MEDVLCHGAEDGKHTGECFWRVGANHERGVTGVGGVHVGLGNGGVDEGEIVFLGELGAEGAGVVGRGEGCVDYYRACTFINDIIYAVSPMTAFDLFCWR